jgi:hypothetical protein
MQSMNFPTAQIDELAGDVERAIEQFGARHRAGFLYDPIEIQISLGKKIGELLAALGVARCQFIERAELAIQSPPRSPQTQAAIVEFSERLAAAFRNYNRLVLRISALIKIHDGDRLPHAAMIPESLFPLKPETSSP